MVIISNYAWFVRITCPYIFFFSASLGKKAIFAFKTPQSLQNKDQLQFFVLGFLTSKKGHASPFHPICTSQHLYNDSQCRGICTADRESGSAKCVCLRGWLPLRKVDFEPTDVKIPISVVEFFRLTILLPPRKLCLRHTRPYPNGEEFVPMRIMETCAWQQIMLWKVFGLNVGYVSRR